MNRHAIRLTVLTTVFLCLGTTSLRAQEPGKPNILFISIDDLNDWIGVLGGHPQAETPNLDRLAHQGILFTNAHCASRLCNASRAALMTGLRPSTTGVYTNRQPFRQARPDAVTLTQHFQEHGYVTLGSGKIYHGRYPDPPSWDEYWPSQHDNRPSDPTPNGRPLNSIAGAKHFDWGPVDASSDEMGDAQVAGWVSEQLRRDFDRPFFLACGIYRPHHPWYSPPEYFDALPDENRIELPEVLDGGLDDLPQVARRIAHSGIRGSDHREVTEHDQWHAAVRGYLASVRFADAMVGRVLDALQSSRYADNTIVILWSDHGWHLGEKEHWRKFALWERATRVVLMAAGPGIAAGEQCDAPVNLLDIYPTLCELAELPQREELEGDSLATLLRNSDAQWDRPTVTTFRRGEHAVKDRRYRYIRYNNGAEELYNHQEDPHEWHNLADREELAEVKQRLAGWIPDSNAPNAPSMNQKWWPGKDAE